MRLKELKQMGSNVPEPYVGREYVERCEYTKEFTIDKEILVISTPKTVRDAEGNLQPMISQKGRPIMDRLVYLPFVGKDGIERFTMTKSPLIWRLVRNLPVVLEDPDHGDETWQYLEPIEGTLRFTRESYKYGDKSVPVATLEDAEE